MPAARTRNHFYDPSRGRGLDEVDGEALRTRINAAATGVGSLRGVFTGASFDGSGMAAPDWLRSPSNDWGLRALLRRAASAPPRRRRRPSARARWRGRCWPPAPSLHVVEDAGDPTFVRDDYRVALEADGGPYERFVAPSTAALGVPDLAGAARRPRIDLVGAAFTTATAAGLANRTQSRFFSPGTLPTAGRYSRPQAVPGRRESATARAPCAHLAHYERTRDGVAWSLDERCCADYAAALLPETTRYAAGALELLFRGRLDVASRRRHRRR